MAATSSTSATRRWPPINRDNVAQLKAEWRIHLQDSGNNTKYSGQGQPIVLDGVIYMSTGANDVFAVSVESGDILWRYTANIDAARVRVCCGWVNRGVAIGEGKVFMGQVDAKLVALDQATGKLLWSVQAEDPLKGYSITAGALYYDGMVIVGFAGGEAGIRGHIDAYDAKNGAHIWRFYTIPGSRRSRAMTPGRPTTMRGSTAARRSGRHRRWIRNWGCCTSPPAMPGPDYNGAQRAGDNLFTVSMLALEVKTGKYRWHFQQVHHDLWDYDSPNPVILFDAPYAGKMRKGIAEVSKTGWVYILDRETGKPLTPIEERPVPQEPRNKTAATQPYVIGDAVVPQQIDIAPEGFDLVNHGRIFTPFWDQVVLYKPQMGANWPPSSVDPRSYRMFICGTDHVGISSSDGKEEFTPPGETSFWAGGGHRPRNHGVARLGTFNAVDLTTNRLVWQQQWARAAWRGTLATAAGWSSSVAPTDASPRWTATLAIACGRSRPTPAWPHRPAPLNTRASSTWWCFRPAR